MKWFLASTVGILLLVILVWWAISPANQASKSSKFAVGKSLLIGNVAPQLVSTWDTAVLLAPDGSLWGWGGTQFGLDAFFGKRIATTVPLRIGADSDWRRVGASWLFTVGLKNDGSLWGWGRNYSGQLAQTNLTNRFTRPVRIGTEANWTDIKTGAGHCIALKSDGSLWAWGQNESGQAGNGTTHGQLSPLCIGPGPGWKSIESGSFNGFALKADGTIWGWGLDVISRRNSNNLVPVQIDPGTNWVGMSAGDFSLVALKSDGTIWIRGQNAHHIAENYARADTEQFAQIGHDRDWREVYAGQSCFFAQKRDRSWWVCGVNQSGAMGMGNVSKAPQRLPFDFEPWAFATGDGNTLLLAKDGTLWTWGERLGSGSTIARGSWKDVTNRVLRFFHIKHFRFEDKPAKNDFAPYRLWELPPAMRRSLIKNARSEKSGDSNAAAGEALAR